MKSKDHHLLLRPGGYSARITRDGKEHWVALDTRVLTVARARRDKLLEEIRGERWAAVEALRARPQVADLEAIAAAYLQWSAGAKLRPATARANVNALRNLVRTAISRTLADTPASMLTPSLLADWQARALAAARPLGPGHTNRALNSTHSLARQARSLFARRPMQRGAYDGLQLPDLDPFLRYSLDRGKIARPVPATSALIARTRQVATAMRKRHPALWLALQCAANLGLRRGEILSAQWDWATAASGIGGAPLVHLQVGGTEDYDAKGRSRLVQLVPSLWTEMLAARQDAGPHILPGPIDERERTVRWLAGILRAIGWRVRKPLHELRRQFGMAVADAHGALAAKDALGHADMRTTTTHYVASLRPEGVRVL